MSEEKAGLIFQKIAEMQKEVKAVGKNGQNQKQKYSFRRIDDIYEMTQGLFQRHEVFIVPNCIAKVYKEFPSSNGGTQHYAYLDMQYTVYATDGSSVSGIVSGEAFDFGDKATNKAMSAAQKYFLVQLLQIPTGDPDSENDLPEDHHSSGSSSNVDIWFNMSGINTKIGGYNGREAVRHWLKEGRTGQDIIDYICSYGLKINNRDKDAILRGDV